MRSFPHYGPRKSASTAVSLGPIYIVSQKLIFNTFSNNFNNLTLI